MDNSASSLLNAGVTVTIDNSIYPKLIGTFAAIFIIFFLAKKMLG